MMRMLHFLLAGSIIHIHCNHKTNCSHSMPIECHKLITNSWKQVTSKIIKNLCDKEIQLTQSARISLLRCDLLKWSADFYDLSMSVHTVHKTGREICWRFIACGLCGLFLETEPNWNYTFVVSSAAPCGIGGFILAGDLTSPEGSS